MNIKQNFPTNTVHTCQRERHFINTSNCALLVLVLGIIKREISHELELLKYIRLHFQTFFHLELPVLF